MESGHWCGFPAEKASVSVGRPVVAEFDELPPQTAHDGVLVVSELLSNALEHARSDAMRPHCPAAEPRRPQDAQ